MQGPSWGLSMEIYIRKGWEEFYRFIIFKVGDGSSIKFWHDPLCEGLPLENIFQNYTILPMISTLQWLSCYHCQRRTTIWIISFIRLIQDWELKLVISFMDLIYS